MSLIGLISDTHGLLRDGAVAALAGCELIVHAGDVGRVEVLETLRGLAPVVAVRGNVDTGSWADSLPETAEAAWGGARFFVLHDVHALHFDPALAGFDFVVSGHSHRASERRIGGVVYVNPGSAGPRRFKLPITVARVDLGVRPWRIEFVPVS